MPEVHDPAPAPRYGWYGDDFTGATDTLATVAEAGLRTMLFLGVPDAATLGRAGPLDAIGIAGAARTMTPEAMEAELDPIGRFLARAGVRVLHYKCCSTFDSAPEVGSIGAAVAILRRHVANPFVPIVGGQPNIGRYCLFSTLFAAAGAQGAVHRLDRHPTMSRHPVTPMPEADLRLHLAAQGLAPVLGLHRPALLGDLDAAREAVVRGAAAVLVDCVDPGDLGPIGRLVWQSAMDDPLVAVGPSSIAQALARHWEETEGSPARATPPLEPATGPVLVLAGSLSPVTRAQVEAAASYETIALLPDRLVAEEGYAASVRADVVARLGQGRHVLASTTTQGTPPDVGRAAEIAQATARLLRGVLRDLPLRRVGVAGGDTSSLAATALGLWGLSYRATLARGVTVCRTHSLDPGLDGIDLMLKGGQMGGRDLFEDLIRGQA